MYGIDECLCYESVCVSGLCLEGTVEADSSTVSMRGFLKKEKEQLDVWKAFSFPRHPPFLPMTPISFRLSTAVLNSLFPCIFSLYITFILICSFIYHLK